MWQVNADNIGLLIYEQLVYENIIIERGSIKNASITIGFYALFIFKEVNGLGGSYKKLRTATLLKVGSIVNEQVWPVTASISQLNIVLKPWKEN